MRARGKIAIGLISILAVPFALGGILGEPRWNPLGSGFTAFVTNESTNSDGEFETAIVGYTIPGKLADVRQALRAETSTSYTWKTQSHAVHATEGVDLWIREFEGFRAPGLNPDGPIHVDFSIRRKAGFLSHVRRIFRP